MIVDLLCFRRCARKKCDMCLAGHLCALPACFRINIFRGGLYAALVFPVQGFRGRVVLDGKVLAHNGYVF